MMATPTMMPPGWYTDPAHRHQYRYWGGTDWTALVSDGAVTATDTLESSAPPPSPQQVAESPPAAAAAMPTAASVVRRRRRSWAIAVVVAAVVLGLAAGLVIWAPWTPAPLLRPTGLTAESSATSSAAFRWSGPAAGPLPDKYVVFSDGKVIGSVRGTITWYHAVGLVPATLYRFRVAAVRDGKRSALSSVLAVTTAAPPLSAARLHGRWTVHIRLVRGAAEITGPDRWSETWVISSKCTAGACAVVLYGTMGGHNFTATLARAGAVYTGKSKANLFPCGPPSNSFPLHYAIRLRLKVTTAHVYALVWTAGSWTGSMVMSSPYTSSGNYYCTASTVTASLSASP